MTLTEILAYANSITEDAFASLSDIIEHLNDAQDKISRIDMIEADPMNFTLRTNSFMLPEDCLMIERMEIDGTVVTGERKPWKRVVTLPDAYTSGTLTLYYYKYPETLLASTPTQVPEVDIQYHRALGTYAARMYFMVDDDPAQREVFTNEFISSLTSLKTTKNAVTTFSNY